MDNQYVDEKLFCMRNNLMNAYRHWVEVENMLGYKISYEAYALLIQRFRLEKVDELTALQKKTLQEQIFACLNENGMLYEQTEKKGNDHET